MDLPEPTPPGAPSTIVTDAESDIFPTLSSPPPTAPASFIFPSSTMSTSPPDTPSRYRLSRSPSMNRPALSPMGPRTRCLSRTTAGYTDSSSSSIRDSLLASPTTEAVPLYPGTPPSSSPPKSAIPLSPIAECAPPLPVKVKLSPPPPAIKIIPKPAMLVPAPQISFDPVPVPFKNLPLEAFLWTLDNKDLQEMVSRAIRQSARESFVRLVSLDILDRTIPTEIQRLSSLKSATQSRYRFLVQRRTMLIQALNSTGSITEMQVQEDGTSVVSTLSQQLSETCAECDQLLETLLMVTDQLGQITKMLDVHWASALAIALRKLNKSYGKRTTELVATKERVEQLEGELEDAWKEAARYAKEMDDVEAANLTSDSDGEEEAVITQVSPLRKASATLLKSRPGTPSPQLNFLDFSQTPPSSAAITPVVPSLVPVALMQTVPTDVSPTLSSPNAGHPELDHQDSASIRSIRSTKSTRSFHSSRISQVFAARTRSQRTSKSSLRFTSSKAKTPVHPPVPELPLELSHSPPPKSAAAFPGRSWNSFRRSSNGPVKTKRPSTAGAERRLASLDAPLLTSKWVDDINVRLRHPLVEEEQTKEATTSCQHTLLLRPSRPSRPPPPVPITSSMPPVWLAADEVPQDLPEIDPAPVPQMHSVHPPPLPPKNRSRPQSARTSTSETRSGFGHFGKARLQGGPASPVVSHGPYSKLKGISKRYSMPFPLFKSISSGSLSVRSLPPEKKGGY